jgi:nucleotide-binding universal stress UspA family protein
MYDKILVPTDGSEAAALGLIEAIRLAKALGSHLRLVHIVDELLIVSPDAAGATLGQIVDLLRSTGESVLAEAESKVSKAGVDVDTVLVEALGGQAGDQILQQAREWGAELIVCGTHGRRGIRRLVLGSDAEYVVRHASLPVLLVRQPAVREERATKVSS